MSDDITKLIAEARRFQGFKTWKYPETDLVRKLADALESLAAECDATIRVAQEDAYDDGIEAAYCAGLEERIKDELIAENPYRERKNDE